MIQERLWNNRVGLHLSGVIAKANPVMKILVLLFSLLVYLPASAQHKIDTSSYVVWWAKQRVFADSIKQLDTAQRLNAFRIKLLEELTFPRADGYKSFLVCDGMEVGPMTDTAKFTKWWNLFLTSKRPDGAIILGYEDSGIYPCRPPSPVVVFTTGTQQKRAPKRKGN